LLDRIPFLAHGSELKKRVIVGLIGAVALVLLISLGGWVGICIFTLAISLAMVNEFSNMAFSLKDQVEKRYAMLCLTWVVGLGNMIVPKSEVELLTFCFLGLFSFFLFTADIHPETEFFAHFKELMHSVFGVFYLICLPLYLTRIQAVADGVRWTILFLLIVWAADSAAYFVGKKFGKKKLYGLISPKKTYEGAAGGLLAGVLIAFIYKILFFRGMSFAAVVFIPLLVGVASQIGDLCESFLKRAYGKKDSGSILPGHGGFLDRFDGVVFSAPVMYACIRIFGV
jgi:phosphatidate cytidylyltransferase